MKKRNRIITLCAIIIIALIGGGTYLHYNAKAYANVEQAQLGYTNAEKYNGKNSR